MAELPELTVPPQFPIKPELFEDAMLFASDYDNTQALTSEPSPNGIDVEVAYNMIVLALFGKTALSTYKSKGGHNNRGPREIVASLVPTVDDARLFDNIIMLSELGYASEDIVASVSGTHIGIKNRRDSLEPEELEIVTRVFSDYKLSILNDQVGLKMPDGGYWPRPVPGFVDFIRDLEDWRFSGQRVDTALISAGHTDFIRRTYDLWEVPEPDIYVTSDTVSMLGLAKQLTPDELAKPSPLLMQIATQQWKRNYGIDVEAPFDNDVLYVGDDVDKDGGLAINSGSDFIRINPGTPEYSWQKVTERLKESKVITPTQVAHG